MHNFFNFGLAAIVVSLTSCGVMAQSTKPAIENLTAKKFTQTTSADYLLFLPKGYEAHAAKRWPIILFLHGSGERGTDVWRTAVHGPIKYIEKNPDFPFIFVSPQCPDGHKWSDEIVLGLLDSIEANYAVDTNRIYLTGLSMGGYGSWSLAAGYPERFAAVAPICGGEGNISLLLSRGDKVKGPALKKLPIWAFHGGKDNVVALAESERMVKLFKEAGNEGVKLTIYPEAEHNSWTVTYDNPELYGWFLKQTLGSNTSAGR